jgi:hypothetical protein
MDGVDVMDEVDVMEEANTMGKENMSDIMDDAHVSNVIGKANIMNEEDVRILAFAQTLVQNRCPEPQRHGSQQSISVFGTTPVQTVNFTADWNCQSI